MAKEQWYVKAKGYKETFDSLKMANASFNSLKKEIKEDGEGYVEMAYRPEGGAFELLKEFRLEDED